MIVEHAKQYIADLADLLAKTDLAELEAIASLILEAHDRGHQIFIVGNGGSASTASHMACDLSKYTVVAGGPRLRAISLTDNIAWISALANDISYADIFIEQLRTLARREDVVIGISVSGNSPNVVGALEYASSIGAKTVAIVGASGGRMKQVASVVLHFPSDSYGHVEDAHLVVNHILATYLRAAFASPTIIAHE